VQSVWDACRICAVIEKCADVIDSQDVLLPDSFIVSLLAAEDHRNDIHPSVAPISILGAIYVGNLAWCNERAPSSDSS